MWSRRAFAHARVNRIQARCQSTPDGVRLRLTINGGLLADVTDSDTPLGPGAVGVGVYASGSNTAAAEFLSFRVR